MHHCSTTLGRRDIVGSLVGSCVGSAAPAARSHGQTRAVVPSLEVGWSVVDGWRGDARSWSLSSCGTGENGFVHAAHGAAHGIGTCHRALVVFAWAGACRAGVVVVHIATMRAAVVPVFETLDRRGGVTATVCAAATVVAAATVCAAATVVAAAAALCVLVATIVASAAAVHGLLVATVVVSTITVVSTAAVSATTTVVAAALLSAAASATWALLVVDDTLGRLAIAEGLAKHLELPLDRVDVGRVGSE